MTVIECNHLDITTGKSTSLAGCEGSSLISHSRAVSLLPDNMEGDSVPVAKYQKLAQAYKDVRAS